MGKLNKTSLKSYETIEDVEVNFKSFGKLVVPKGTLVTNNTASGPDDNYTFVAEYGWIKLHYPTIANILEFDVKHYGILIPKDKLVKI